MSAVPVRFFEIYYETATLGQRDFKFVKVKGQAPNPPSPKDMISKEEMIGK